jgi:hypothetical protein
LVWDWVRFRVGFRVRVGVGVGVRVRVRVAGVVRVGVRVKLGQVSNDWNVYTSTYKISR